MATLPDLDTTNVSTIEYYNVIDQNAGVDSIEVDSALDWGELNEYTLYDNGWVGSISASTGDDIVIRAKNDGWVTSHLDRTENYALTTDASNIKGRISIADIGSASGSSTETDLSRAINGFVNNLDSSDNIIFNYGDQRVYDYQNPDASQLAVYNTSLNNELGSVTVDFSTGTDVKYGAISCSTSSDITGRWDGTVVAQNGNSGAIDITDVDISTSHEVTASTQFSASSARFNLVVLFS